MKFPITNMHVFKITGVVNLSPPKNAQCTQTPGIGVLLH